MPRFRRSHRNDLGSLFAASIVTALPAIAFVAPAHADQARKMAEHGGRAAILGIPQWNFTKVEES